MPISKAASSPARTHSRSTSCTERACTSSIRVGWIRPSATSSSRVSRAISRRTGSKQLSSTVSGVSSMTTLTPVICSKDADVASLAPDHPALHVVGRQVHDRHHRLAGLLRGEPLDRRGEHLAGVLLGLVGGCLLDVAREQGGRPPGIGLHRGHQLGAGLLDGEPGDALEHGPPVGLEVEQLGAPGLEGGLGVGQLVGPLVEVPLLAVEPLLALGDPVLAPLDVLTLLVQVLVELVLARGRALAVHQEQHDGRHREQDHHPEDPHEQLGQRRGLHGRAPVPRARGRRTPTTGIPSRPPDRRGGRGRQQERLVERGPAVPGSLSSQPPVPRSFSGAFRG